MTESTPIIEQSSLQAKNTRILLADDHPLMRYALKDILEKQQTFEIIGEACDGLQAVQLANEKLPDLIIMDISMPNLNGLEATRQIKVDHPEISVLVLTVHTDTEHVLGILKAGADGYLVKSANHNEIVKTISALVAGETVISPSVAQKLFKYAFQHMNKPVNLDTGEKLSAREKEILRLLAQGISNKDISLKLGLSLRTIKSYLADMFLKLDVSSRTEAVVIGLRKGILTKEDLE